MKTRTLVPEQFEPPPVDPAAQRGNHRRLLLRKVYALGVVEIEFVAVGDHIEVHWQPRLPHDLSARQRRKLLKAYSQAAKDFEKRIADYLREPPATTNSR